MPRQATITIDRWIQLAELAELFGLSEESMKRFAKKITFRCEIDALSQAGSHRIRVPALVESSTAGTSRTHQADSSVTNIAVPKIF
jgi:hypothetical protein